MASERFRLLLISMLEWVENKRSYSRCQDMAIEWYAADQLRRRLKKVSRKGRQLEKLPARARHKIRIRVKKIRYALDFFEAVFPDRRKSIARLSKVLEEIQDALGALNDFVAHRRLAADSALMGTRANRRARAFVAGIVVGHEDEATTAMMKNAVKGLRRLRQLNVF